MEFPPYPKADDERETQRKVDSVVAELRQRRGLLDELNAEYKRAGEAIDARHAKYTTLMEALRANPSRETAEALATHCGADANVMYKRAQDIQDRRREVREAMEPLQQKLQELLGVQRTPEDW